MFLVLIFGVFMIFQYFVPHETSEWVYEYLLDWIIVIGVFALAPGLWSLYRVSVDRVKTRKPNWIYSYVTLLGLLIMIIFGFTARTGDSWGLFVPFIICMGASFALLTTASAAKKGKPVYLGASGLLLLVAIIIAATDDTWGFYFRTQEGLTSFMFVHFFDHILIPIFASMFALLAFFISSAAYRAFRARNILATLLLLAALIVMSRFNPYLEPIFGDYLPRMSNWLMNVPNLAAQRAIVIGVGLGMVATALKVILGIERGYMGRG
jgi:hypothetical protein